MQDHLLCVVEQLMNDGYSEEHAFLIATQRMGESRLLRDEFRKTTREAFYIALRYSSELVAFCFAVLIALKVVACIDPTSCARNCLIAIHDLSSHLLEYFL
jgi:hypothetical protein